MRQATNSVHSSAEVRMIRNGVCPSIAAALVKANFAHEQQIVRAA